MPEEKNSLLAYLLDNKPEKIFCKELDKKRRVNTDLFEKLIFDTVNIGQHLKDSEDIGEHIPMVLDTSYEFLSVFFGILAAKKVSVPIHTISNQESIGFILEKIKAKSLIVTKKHLYRKIANIPYVQEHIHTIFATQDLIDNKLLPCKHVDLNKICNQKMKLGQARKYIQSVVNQTRSDDAMQVVFTSGTTGIPKGAVLSHRNVISCVVKACHHLKIHSGYRTLTFLPLSHVMAQNEVFIAYIAKATIQIVGRENILMGLKKFKPNILVAVPRVYQAIYSGIQRKLRNNKIAKKLVNFAINTTIKAKQDKSILKRLVNKFFAKTIGSLITSKIRNNMGHFNLLVTAGAACPKHIFDFFEAIGLPLTNAQGLTEVSGAIIYNKPNETLGESIGFPLPGVQVKIADDGEILIKGDPVFSKYFEEPELTKASFTDDGWFKTGDLGRKEIIHNKPYVFLKGRKKEILVLSSGLNIPASRVEHQLLKHELISQAMVVGDGKPKLAALIVPNEDYLKCNKCKVTLYNEISKAVRQANECMDICEHIGEFKILKEPFTIENGMLTPTLKIRRPVVTKRYEKIIGQFYQASAS